MKTINIVHPNDPRDTAQPLTVTLKEEGRVDRMRRERKDAARLQPFAILGADKAPLLNSGGKPLIVWQRPGTVPDSTDWLQAVQNICSGWVNAPEGDDGKAAEFTADNLILLFDEKYDVADYVAPHVKNKDGELFSPSTVSFGQYLVIEYSNPERWANPTQGGSKTT